MMKLKAALAATLALGLFAAAPADAQYRHDRGWHGNRGYHRGDGMRGGYGWRHRGYYGWHRHRHCGWVWRYHRRIRVCGW